VSRGWLQVGFDLFYRIIPSKQFDYFGVAALTGVSRRVVINVAHCNEYVKDAYTEDEACVFACKNGFDADPFSYQPV